MLHPLALETSYYYQAQEEAQVSGKEQEQELVQALEQHASVVQFLHWDFFLPAPDYASVTSKKEERRDTRGEGDRAMLPMEAFNSSTEGAAMLVSAGSGLILILNFLRWSSSSSDSLEEKK